MLDSEEFTPKPVIQNGSFLWIPPQLRKDTRERSHLGQCDVRVRTLIS